MKEQDCWQTCCENAGLPLAFQHRRIAGIYPLLPQLMNTTTLLPYP